MHWYGWEWGGRYEEERFVRLVTSKKDRKEKQKLQVSAVMTAWGEIATAGLVY